MRMRRMVLLLGLSMALGGCGSSTPTGTSPPTATSTPSLAGAWEIFKNTTDLRVAVTFEQSGGSLTATFTVNSNGNPYASGTGSVTASRAFALHEVYPGGTAPGIDAICDYSGTVDSSASKISGNVTCNTGAASFEFHRK